MLLPYNGALLIDSMASDISSTSFLQEMNAIDTPIKNPAKSGIETAGRDRKGKLPALYSFIETCKAGVSFIQNGIPENRHPALEVA